MVWKGILMAEQDNNSVCVDRNKEGVAVLGNKTVIKVSPQRSVLSYANPHCGFVDGGDYADDGYIYDAVGRHFVFGKYTKRKHMRQVHIENDSVLIWEPIKEDLILLELRRWKMSQAVRKAFDTMFMPIYNQLIELGQAHAKVKVNFKYKGDQPPWWLYTMSEVSGQKGIVGDWVDKSEEPINLDIGNKYHYATKRMQDFYSRKRRFDTAFKWALCEFVKQQEVTKFPGANLRLTINDRDYWFVSVMGRYGGWSWNLTVFPEDKTMEIEI